VNLSIQKRINCVARAIEYRFKKKLQALEAENSSLRAQISSSAIPSLISTVQPLTSAVHSDKTAVYSDNNTEHTVILAHRVTLAVKTSTPALQFITTTDPVTHAARSVTTEVNPITSIHSVTPAVHSVTSVVHSTTPAIHYATSALHSVTPTVQSLTHATHSIIPAVHSITSEDHSVTPVVQKTDPKIHLLSLNENVLNALEWLDPHLLGYTFWCEPIINLDAIESLINQIGEEYEYKKQCRDKSYIHKGWLGSLIRRQIGPLDQLEFNKIISYLYTFSMCYYTRHIKYQQQAAPKPYTIDTLNECMGIVKSKPI